MHYDYRHHVDDRVVGACEVLQAGDAYYNGRVGTVVGHALDWDDDRVWPEVLVLFDGTETPARVLDYNLKLVAPER